ncbi:tripartite-type tricarboxylate transporter receptor subunit TctC [Pseudorhizobium tarimense]|uniref:Tripartite-type tricarboxylate transporter receptor subunit TctC n=1 Tax=Pseudorhizobium tarimense TaxID=1079109 RepID=A0ABV2HBG8_9HYPH|nr:tripartite tricarboxylate transporter substrate-binding protein [Pseudorhizobium tarimense]MCJ8520945.1 hypothetical protein [Pseudorhizobium tarimense]
MPVKRVTKRATSGLVMLGLTLGLVGPANAQEYPNQPIKFIVGFAAGGFADSMGRVIAQAMSENLGQPVVVENQGGAGGNIAAANIAAAPDDGYTVLVTTAGISLTKALGTKVEYDLADLTPVAIPVSSPEVLAANPQVPASNLAELIEWAKAQDKVTLGSAGKGTSSQITTSYFLNEVAGLENVVEVTYQGGGPANQAAIAGEVNLVGSSNSAYPFIREGLLKGLAIADTTRHDAIPDVGTFKEQGFDGVIASSWVGLFVPASTNSEIVETLNAAVNKALDEPNVIKSFQMAGVKTEKRDVAETKAFFEEDIASWSKMASAVGGTSK